MAYRIPLGGRMANPTVNRSNVAEGFPGRAIMLGPDCIYAKALYYDERIKRSVEVDQEAILKYRFDKVLTYYYILIARLNTDNRSEVVSDDIVLEYLRLSEAQYETLCTEINEVGNFSSLILTKIKKVGQDGKDFSYTEVKVSNYNRIPESAKAKVDKMVATPNFVQNIWEMVDASTSITVEMYEQKLNEYFKEQAAKAGQAAPQQTFQQVPVAPQQPPRRIIGGAGQTQIQRTVPAAQPSYEPQPAPVYPSQPVQGVVQSPVVAPAPHPVAHPAPSINSQGAAVFTPQVQVQPQPIPEPEMAGMDPAFEEDFGKGDFSL